MKKYKHIIFDLDHTLWDFETNSKETLIELFGKHSLDTHLKASSNEFVTHYKEVNVQLWHLYNQHLISKDDLRIKRFQMVFEYFNFFDSSLAKTLDEEYISICPEKPNLIDGTMDTLKELSNRYHLHLLTNGFKETQERKIQSCKIAHFFDTMITSECSGYNKPNRLMFSYTLNKINAHYKDCIMIGDNLKTDIQGAKNVGMDHVFFNPNKIQHGFKVTHEITHLKDLLKIL